MDIENIIQKEEQEMYQAIFYFHSSKAVHEEYHYTMWFCLLTLAGFLISGWFTYLIGIKEWRYINYFFAGFLFGIPVLLFNAFWHRRHCLDKVLFEKEGVTANQRFFLATDIRKLKMQGEYLKLETVRGETYTYWIDPRFPAIVKKKLAFELKNLNGVLAHD